MSSIIKPPTADGVDGTPAGGAGGSPPVAGGPPLVAPAAPSKGLVRVAVADVNQIIDSLKFTNSLLKAGLKEEDIITFVKQNYEDLKALGLTVNLWPQNADAFREMTKNERKQRVRP